MTRYLFGLHLDGAPVPDELQGIHSAVCGPEGFLSALETSLGLPPVIGSALERTLAYRNVIDASLGDGAFYQRSFRWDPLATARLLLSWRDGLREAGWQPEGDHQGAPPRLAALAALEAPFQETGLSQASHAGRIATILAELELVSSAGIQSLVVIDPSEILPRCWRELFTALGATYDSRTPESPLADPATTLGSSQAHLLGQGDAPASDRGSLRMVTSTSPEETADALAAQIAALDAGSVTLIADPAERNLLNRHLARLNLPLPPSRSECAAALLEAPSLVLGCRLAPFSPQAWLEFLLHPVSPVPSALRRRLAAAINDRPALGDHWNSALEECCENAADEAQVERLRTAYADWIDVPFIDPETITGEALADAVARLAEWLAKRAGGKASEEDADASEWILAAREVRQLESILRSEGTLTRTGTERLFAEWHRSASGTTRFPGEVGAVASAATPAQLLAPQDHIIWWRPAPSHANPLPWTVGESEWLSAHGVELPDPERAAVAAEQSAMRPVLLAGKSLTFYHVTQAKGSPTEHAGILTRLLSHCGSSIVVPARELVSTRLAPRKALPPLRRWWDLGGKDVLPPRETESFSSVSKFIFSPVDWVLDHHARLRRGPVSELRVCDDVMRSGSLLHSVAEQVFTSSQLDWRSADEAAISQWIAGHFRELLTHEAAHYLVPGNEAARARLLNTAQRSISNLVSILQDAGVSEVVIEHTSEPAVFPGGRIGGRIDLIARRADGSSAVIDLKLGGKSTRSEELATNLHLQLATYGHLLRASEGIEPATAFFILSNGGTLLTRSSGFFQNTSPVSPKKGTPTSDWQECWEEFEEIYQWRRGQLDHGLIEVPVPGTEPDDPPPLDRWAPPKDGNRYSPYLNLTGWDPHA